MAQVKKLTYQQRKVLSKNGIPDASEWRYVKEESVADDGGNLSKNGTQNRYIIIRNINTGEEIKVRCTE